MAKIISASEVLASTGGGMYLDKDQKAELHRTQAPFWITYAIAEQDGQFGPQSVFHVKLQDATEARLAFGASQPRRELAEKISHAIAQGADGVGPFYLGRWENGNRSGWTLTGDPTTPLDIPDVEPAPPAPSFGIQKVIDNSDDIPF
jgi:hypothetical protein